MCQHATKFYKLNSMVWVRERTIPTERPPLVGEVTANFCGWRVPRCQRDRSLRPYFRFFWQEPLLFYQVTPQLYSRGWVDPVPDPLLFFPGSVGNRTRASGSVAKKSEICNWQCRCLFTDIRLFWSWFRARKHFTDCFITNKLRPRKRFLSTASLTDMIQPERFCLLGYNAA
jgi:hypothetical protein